MKSQRHPSLHLFVLDLSQRSISLVVSEGLMEFLCKQDGGAPLNVCCKQANEQMKSKVMSSLTRGDGWCTEEMQAGRPSTDQNENNLNFMHSRNKLWFERCNLHLNGRRCVNCLNNKEDAGKEIRAAAAEVEQNMWNRFRQRVTSKLNLVCINEFETISNLSCSWVYRIFLLISIRSGI